MRSRRPPRAALQTATTRSHSATSLGSAVFGQFGYSFAFTNSSIPHHVSGDDELLDLAGAFVEAQQADVAVEALDCVFGHVAGAAVDLHGAVGDLADHFGAEQLAGRGFEGDVFAGVALARGFEHHAARGVGLGAGIGEHRLDELLLGEGFAELPALHGVGEGVGDEALGDADGNAGNVQPAAVEHLHCGDEAFAFAADDIGRGHRAILEDHIAGERARLPHLPVHRAEGQPRRAALDDERGNAPGALDLRVGAGHHIEGLGHWRVGDVALGAVEQVTVAVAGGGGAQRGGVGAGFGFGQAETADPLAAGVFWQVFPLLLFGSVEHDRRRADAIVGADQRAERRRGLAEFDGDEDFLFHGQTEAAVLFRDRQAEQAELLHFGDDFLRHPLVLGKPLLSRHEPLAHKALDQGKQLVERFLVSDHGWVSRRKAWANLTQPKEIPRLESCTEGARRQAEGARRQPGRNPIADGKRPVPE